MLHTSSKKRNITFFGGEPVLNISGLRFGLEQINKLFESEERNIFIVTNGTYITDEIVRLFKEYRVFPIVSIDGWEEIHNHMRVYGNGHGSYNDTITGYNLLQKNGINIGISTLIGKHNYKYLPEIVEFFIHELKAFNLGISLPHVKPDIAEVSIEELTPVLIRCWEIARDNNFYIMQIGKRLKALATKKANLRSCPGADTWSMLRVLPDGTITPCENMGLRGEAILGNVNDNISPDEILNHHVLYSWNRRSPYTMAECSKCMCINICGGGCPYDAFLETDSIYQPERRSCYLSIELLKWAVKEIYKHVDMDDKLVIPTREQRYAILPQQLPYFV
jgi:radical SAM protein with 4Fe4S-binding SPASM domain